VSLFTFISIVLLSVSIVILANRIKRLNEQTAALVDAPYVKRRKRLKKLLLLALPEDVRSQFGQYTRNDDYIEEILDCDFPLGRAKDRLIILKAFIEAKQQMVDRGEWIVD